MSKRSLPLLLAIALASLGGGCSLAVKSELDGKLPQPEDECTTDADCSGAFVVCQLDFNELDYYQACSCARGYEEDPATGECTFVGIVGSPGFDDASQWTVHGDVEINATASGNGDPGVLTIGSDGLCDRASGVSQTVAISRATDAVPLVIEVTHRTQNWPEFQPVGVGVNGTWYSVPGANSWTTSRVCLGPGDTGGEVTLTVAGAFTHPDCQWGISSELEVTRVDIVPANAGECPAIGTALNGDFESAGGWVDADDASGDVFAGIEAGVGSDGSAALRFGTGPGGGYAGSSGSLLVPDDGPDGAYALRFWLSGTPGARLSVRAGFYNVGRATVPAIGSAIVTMCMPPFARGAGHQLVFTSRPDYTSSTEFIVDDVELVHRGECDDNATVLDGSFELAGVPDIEAGQPVVVNGGGNGTLTFSPVVDPLHARTGDAAYVFESSHRCDYVYPYDPPTFWAGGWNPGEMAKPALTFWYLVDDMSIFQMRTSLDADTDYLPEDAGWQRHRVCLPAESNGRPINFGFQFNDPAGGSCVAIATQRIFLDDFEVVDDPTCP